MKKYIKFISGVLALCILTATVCGCDKNSGASTVKKPSKPQTADSSDTSSDNSSDNTSSDDDTSIDISDDFEDLDFDIDFTTNQVFTFAKTAVNSNIKGTGGILPCWWYFPDSTIDGGYSESDIQIAVEQLKNMKVSIVRCLSFQPGYAWDEASSSYNWDSVYMKAFYRYAKVLKDNGMEIVINPNRNLADPQAGEPVCTPFKRASDAKNEDEYNRLYGEWVVELINEVIIKRGFTNIKYLMYNTEANNIGDVKADNETAYYAEHKKYFDLYLGRIKASDKAMREAGVRNYLKIVGPNAVTAPTAKGYEKHCGKRWLEWAVQYGNDCIDIYSAHFYAYLTDYTQDAYHDLLKQEQEFVEIVKPTGKEFWHDEFNTMKQGYSSATEKEDDPLQPTTLASMVLAMYEGGAQSSMLWYLFDVKWPESDLTAPPERFEGIHYGGVCPVSYESTIPYTSYYLWCALGSAIKTGDTVYSGSTTGENFHSVMFKHADGTYSIVAVNITWDKTDVTFKLPVSLKGKEFTKTVYDPTTVTPTTEYKPLEPMGTVKITSSFKDTIGSYQVVVYNQK